jgi:hypothetical protein
MQFTRSHGGPLSGSPATLEKVFIWARNASASTAIARGQLCVWDTGTTGRITGLDVILLPGSEGTSQRIAGVAEEAGPVTAAADIAVSQIGFLVQVYGYHAAVTSISMTAASNRVLVSSTTAGSANIAAGAATTAAEAGGAFATCLTASGTVTSVEAFLRVM